MNRILELHRDTTEYVEAVAKLNKNTDEKQEKHQNYSDALDIAEKEMDVEFVMKLDSAVGALLAVTDETAFELGFRYACEVMQALGFGGVVNG